MIFSSSLRSSFIPITDSSFSEEIKAIEPQSLISAIFILLYSNPKILLSILTWFFKFIVILSIFLLVLIISLIRSILVSVPFG